jgi:hypothetical protein
VTAFVRVRTVPVRSRLALAGLLALAGVVAATLAAGNAVRMGEPPATLLPFARAVTAWGLPALCAYRLAATALLWTAVARVVPRHRVAALAVLGLGWLCWTGWQLWLLLALT